MDVINEIIMKVMEDNENFIYTTIYPFCEEVSEQKLSKKRLKRLLLLGLEKEKELNKNERG